MNDGGVPHDAVSDGVFESTLRALDIALAELEQVKKERDEAKRSEAGARKAAWEHGQCRREAEAERDRLAEAARPCANWKHITREDSERLAAALASMEGDNK